MPKYRDFVLNIAYVETQMLKLSNSITWAGNSFRENSQRLARD